MKASEVLADIVFFLMHIFVVCYIVGLVLGIVYMFFHLMNILGTL